MRKFKGAFFYYVRGILKQYCFRGASEKQVEDWRKVFMNNKKIQFIKADVRPEGGIDKEMALHLGW